MAWGLIARSDRGGLGMESRQFYTRLKPDKVLVMDIGDYDQYPAEFPGAMIIRGVDGLTPEVINQFLDGIDIIFTFETCYSPDIFRIAQLRGVKTITHVYYEWLHYYERAYTDQLIAAVPWHLTEMGNPVVMPFPIDREKFKFRLREAAVTFLFINGHGGGHDRNGLELLQQALRFVTSPIKLIIYSQIPIGINDPRVEVRLSDFPDASKFYEEADVYLCLRRYAGQSLALNEAMSCGLAVIATDMEPHNKVIPKDCLVPVVLSEVTIVNPVEYGTFKPEELAKLIDRLYGKRIALESEQSNQTAQSLSWEVWQPKWEKLLHDKL